MGCGGRDSVGAKRVCRAASRRERTTARRTKGARCVRQNRVVPTPVAGAKPPVANLIQPGRSAIKPAAMEARGIRLQGEHGISRQTIAQGMPDCSDCTCMLVCVFFCARLHTRPRVQQAPGIPCSLCFLGDTSDANLGRIRRENAKSYPRHCERSEAIHGSTRG